MLQQLAGILLPVFALVGVGYGWNQLSVPFDREFVTRVIMNIAGPCLIVDSLAGLELPPEQFAAMAAASVAAFVATMAAAFALLKGLGLSTRS